MLTKIKSFSWYLNDFIQLKKQLKQSNRNPVIKIYPKLKEKFTEGGRASGDYFHQDLLVAQRIFKNNPKKHVDIASRVDGFIAHVASYREIEMFDIRPISNEVTNMKFVQADLMQLDPALIDYTDSISTLHAIEHFGLGRYNDPIDIHGHLKALDNIYQILQKGGTFYFSTPIGKQTLYFNAHRVFSVQYLLDLFKEKYALVQFSYVDDRGDLHHDVNISPDEAATSFGCKFGCGIFELKKI